MDLVGFLLFFSQRVLATVSTLFSYKMKGRRRKAEKERGGGRSATVPILGPAASQA